MIKKYGFSGLCLRMRNALVSGRKVALMTLWFDGVQFILCGRLFPCSELLLLLQEGHKLCCSVCGVCSVMARLLLRASVRGYFTSPLRRGSDQVLDTGFLRRMSSMTLSLLHLSLFTLCVPGNKPQCSWVNDRFLFWGEIFSGCSTEVRDVLTKSHLPSFF